MGVLRKSGLVGRSPPEIASGPKLVSLLDAEAESWIRRDRLPVHPQLVMSAVLVRSVEPILFHLGQSSLAKLFRARTQPSLRRNESRRGRGKNALPREEIRCLGAERIIPRLADLTDRPKSKYELITPRSSRHSVLLEELLDQRCVYLRSRHPTLRAHFRPDFLRLRGDATSLTPDFREMFSPENLTSSLTPSRNEA